MFCFSVRMAGSISVVSVWRRLHPGTGSAPSALVDENENEWRKEMRTPLSSSGSSLLLNGAFSLAPRVKFNPYPIKRMLWKLYIYSFLVFISHKMAVFPSLILSINQFFGWEVPLRVWDALLHQFMYISPLICVLLFLLSGDYLHSSSCALLVIYRCFSDGSHVNSVTSTGTGLFLISSAKS